MATSPCSGIENTKSSSYQERSCQGSQNDSFKSLAPQYPVGDWRCLKEGCCHIHLGWVSFVMPEIISTTS